MMNKKKTANRIIKAGVAGWPVGHTLSPRLHRYWLKKYHINGEYNACEVSPEKLADFIKSLKEQNIKEQNIAGLNLTVPHKEKIFPYLDEIDDMARKIGAVNTIIINKNRLYGRNTDGYGFLANLKAKAPDWSGDNGPAVVIGAGGAARAVIVSLLEQGVPEIRLINRTRARAERLAEIYRDKAIMVCDWQERSQKLSDAALLVNTTILGMKGQAPLDIDLSRLPLGAVVYDIVYTPLETDLLKQARGRGNPCVDGLGMLLYQAVPAFQAWFGQEVTVDEKLRHYIISGMGR